ncbi:cytochrome c3 family protein [bacterium]|nr:cytochrome c3 family protein [bacterium]
MKQKIIVSCCLLVSLFWISNRLEILRADDKYTQESIKKYHSGNGVTCEFCHKVKNPSKPPANENCFWCHGKPESVAKLTEKLKSNPHNSHHWGTGLECQVCHKTHDSSVNMCSSCHNDSGYKVP